MEFAGWVDPWFRQQLIDVVGRHTVGGSEASKIKNDK